MSLEQILKTGRNYLHVSQVLEDMKKDATNPKNLQNYLDYVAQDGEQLSGEGLESMAEVLSKDSGKFRTLIEVARQREQDSLVENVSKKYKELVNTIPENLIQRLAIQLPDKDKKFMEIEQYLERKDYKAAQKAYSETFDNQSWRDFIALADTDFIMKFAEKYVAIQQRKFLKSKGMIKEVEREGKLHQEFDYTKAKSYIKNTIDAYESDDEKKGAYLMLGTNYLRSKFRERQEAEQGDGESEQEEYAMAA